MGKMCIGVDVGGTTVKIGVFEVFGELLLKWEVPTRKEEGGKYIIADTAASIREKLKESGWDLEDITGVGLGVPGPVMPDGYVVVCVNLGWRDKYPAKELSDLLDGVSVRSGNDANVAALGEMWQGGGKGYKDIIMVTLGTGVGGGVILNEKIWNGKNGLAGEIGHCHVRDEETLTCNCGGVGCLEQVASATGIAREARRIMEKSDKASVLRSYGDEVTAKNVLDAAKDGDELANEVVEVICRYLGMVLGNLTMIIDPEIFVIGGGVSKAGEFLIDVIKKYYQIYTPISDKKGGIGLAQLGNDAGIYGAARLILD